MRKHKLTNDGTDESIKRKAANPNFDLLNVLSPKGPTKSTASDGPILDIDIKDIKDGNLYQRIEGRVTNKTFTREFEGNRTGRSFSFNLSDDTGTIRVSVFNSVDAFDTIYKDIQLNHVYGIAQVRVARKNAAYNDTAHALEAFWTPKSTYVSIQDNGAYPGIEFNFLSLSEVTAKDVNSLADIIGVAGSVGDIQEISVGRIRNVTIVDIEGTRIDATLWHGAADQLELEQGDVVAIKGAKIKSYMGVISLNVERNSVFWVDPDVPESRKLKDWLLKSLKKKCP